MAPNGGKSRQLNRADPSFEVRHKPVLAREVLATLEPRPGQTIVDCTVGLGGHSAMLLEKIRPSGKLIGFDFDAENLEIATGRLKVITDGDFVLFQENFAAIGARLKQIGVNQVDAILADLGVASPQIDDPSRGFSYKNPGPLDMRMDQTRNQSAAQLLAKISQDDLEKALLELGDETDAPQIAKLICTRRKLQPITTTEQLTSLVCEARDFTLQRAAGAKLHPAARTFQAIRMLVNRETENLEQLLRMAPSLLRPGGRIAIISFHSGEDRRVKKSFRDLSRAGSYAEISPDPITANDQEIAENPRSRSAKLRWAKRSP